MVLKLFFFNLYYVVSYFQRSVWSVQSILEACPWFIWKRSVLFFCHFCLNKLIVKILDESTKVGWIGFAKYSRQILGLVSYIRGNPLRPMSSLFCCYLWINMPFVDKYDFFQLPWVQMIHLTKDFKSWNICQISMK